MTTDERTRLTGQIQRQFARYLRRSGFTGKTLAIHLQKIFRDWVALPHWRETYKLEEIEPPDWIHIQESVLGEIRQRWTQNAQDTHSANKKRVAKETNAARQLSLF